jgi:hypothetical protein
MPMTASPSRGTTGGMVVHQPKKLLKQSHNPDNTPIWSTLFPQGCSLMQQQLNTDINVLVDIHVSHSRSFFSNICIP